MHNRVALFAGVCAALGTVVAAKAAPSETVLYSFPGKPAGGYPTAGLVPYGKNYLTTTTGGGPHPCNGGFHNHHLDCGTVAELLPPTAQRSAWSAAIVHSFRQRDGFQSLSGLVGDKAGHFFTTTRFGAVNNGGSLVELTPPAGAGQPWTEQVIYSPLGNPVAPPYRDAAGNLFVVSEDGGTISHGGVYEFSPNANGGWTVTLIFSCVEGAFAPVDPWFGATGDSQGNLYFTTEGGGPNLSGVAMKLSPPGNGGTTWTATDIYDFGANAKDGAFPIAGLRFDRKGNLIGTTELGGVGGYGTVFRLSPPANGGTAWTETVLYSFTGGADGGSPLRGPIEDAAGNLFLTTQTGHLPPQNGGAVDELSPPANGRTAWTETTLYQFKGQPDGDQPNGSLIADDAGNLLTTTQIGGAYNAGAVVEISGTGFVPR